MRRGILFVLSGASGVGKGSMLQLALTQTENLEFSVSWTTRPRREKEIEGQNYHFKTREEFENELAHSGGGGFLEHAEFVSHLYGTPRRPIEEWLAAGKDVVVDIELAGAMQVRQQMPDAVFILVVPPNLSILRQRLLQRGTDGLSDVQRRLERAREDMAFAVHFDYVIVNDRLHDAVEDLAAIIRAERVRFARLDPDEFIQHASTDPTLESQLDRIEETIRTNSNLNF